MPALGGLVVYPGTPCILGLSKAAGADKQISVHCRVNWHGFFEKTRKDFMDGEYVPQSG